MIITCTGSLITNLRDIRNQSSLSPDKINQNHSTVLVIDAPLVEKANSFKANASLKYLHAGKEFHPGKEKVILYFKKETSVEKIGYGSIIVISKPLQPIKNSGNPGSFDYRRYCLFQSVTHQVYLTAADYVLVRNKETNTVAEFIYRCRHKVLEILRGYIRSPKELGLAEALLIGYKDDLDKDLVQAYTSTGVVHIIAISGMHLALIYGLLVWLTKPLKKMKFMRTLMILCGLWLFTLMAGAQASVVRSCVMFTCLATGEFLGKKSSMYNTLAISAFILLCYNPFWLWDIGFQLSYAAVLSIMVFYKKIYGLLYLPNRLLDALWKTIAVCLAAQILTTPFSLFHFHQFPVLFLLTNVVAVPLSGIILFGEIALCAFAWSGQIATITGSVIVELIRWMNFYIGRLETVSFAVWNGFSVSMVQLIMMYLMITGIYWLIVNRKHHGMYISVFSLLVFVVCRTYSFINAGSQNRMVIYNIPRHTTVEFIQGHSSLIISDPLLWQDKAAVNFHLVPALTIHRVHHVEIRHNINHVAINGTRIVIFDSLPYRVSPGDSTMIDVGVLSGHAKFTINQLQKNFRIRMFIITGSVKGWMSYQWKKECDSLNIPCHDVSEKGAFVMNL